MALKRKIRKTTLRRNRARAHEDMTDANLGSAFPRVTKRTGKPGPGRAPRRQTRGGLIGASRKLKRAAKRTPKNKSRSTKRQRR